MTSRHFWLHHNCEVNVQKFRFNKTSNANFSTSFQAFQMRLDAISLEFSKESDIDLTGQIKI